MQWRVVLWIAVAYGCALPPSPRPAPAAPTPVAEAPPAERCQDDQPPGCAVFGFDLGTTRCTPEGHVDITQCATVRSHAEQTYNLPATGYASGGHCGNGLIDVVKERTCAPCVPPGPCACGDSERKLEQCDGKALDGQTCTSLGFLGGKLGCRKDCRFDVTSCTRTTQPLPSLELAGLAGLRPGVNVPGTIAAMSGAVAVAWLLPGPPPRNGNPMHDAVFAWADPKLGSLRATTPFQVGHAGRLAIAGNVTGWLFAVESYGDNPGPEGPRVRVAPVSAQGRVGAFGTKTPGQGLQFLVRGAGHEPSLVGLTESATANGRPTWQLEAYFVDAAGEPIGKPFAVGSPTPGYSYFAARAAVLGGDRFVTARGSNRDDTIELAIVDTKGAVQVLPIAHADLRGAPVALAVDDDRITLVYTRLAPTAATYAITFRANGDVLGSPAHTSDELAAGVIGGAKHTALVTTHDGVAKVQPLGGTAQTLLGAPALYIPTVADSDDGSYALVIARDSAKLVKLR